MILNDTQIDEILKRLLDRTSQGKLQWHRENDHLVTGLPNQTTIEVAANEGPEVVVKVKGASGVVYGEVKSPKAPETPAGRLYMLASEEAAKSIFSEIMDSLELTDSVAVGVVRAVSRVSPEQAALVLQKMQGSWNLDFSRGRERVKINSDGTLFRNEDKEPAFQLKVLAWNENTSSAEVAKDRPDGRRLQIEYLTITPDAMTGYAKHDGHRLFYKKV